uniref:Uncharacterized protein n=1 Tax=Arundo donax TaxID=35708 RepID=A0A0A9CGZ3_ARUDO
MMNNLVLKVFKNSNCGVRTIRRVTNRQSETCSTLVCLLCPNQISSDSI